MKALTIQQPWATLVAVGAKKIETRSWKTDYRGPLAIHASKKILIENEVLCSSPPFEDALIAAGINYDGDIPLSQFVPTGAVIAICNLVDCVLITSDNVPAEPERSFGDYTPGRYAWHLEDVRILPEPVPVKGRLGLWEWNPPE